MFGWRNNEAAVRLGKRAPRRDPRNLKFARYAQSLMTPPVSMDYSNRLHDLDVLGNDTLGNCAEAGAAHMHQAWRQYNGGDYRPSTEAVVQMYSAVTGYVPGDALTDNGTVMLDLLKYWQREGIDGHRIGPYVEVDATSELELKQALYFFGGLYVGLQLPKVAQSQWTWDVPWYGTRGPGKPGGWGGHCVAGAVRYDESTLSVITWGKTQPVTWEFVRAYCDECYVVLADDWLSGGVTPTGFAMETLVEDIQVLGGRAA